ncbi:hypothetical protein [Rhodopila sp.]|uniref:hypothetical protein n=1 Tax=Rhodopila sp. TaxID=2480087 RepID=UPI003D11E0B5
MAFHSLHLQIPPSPLRAHLVHARVKVRQYPDGCHVVFHGQRCLTRYDRAGLLQEGCSDDAGMSAASKSPAGGFMENPSRLPTTPQPQHQVKRGDETVFVAEDVIEKCDDDWPPDLPPEQALSRSTNTKNEMATSGQLMCYLHRTS